MNNFPLVGTRFDFKNIILVIFLTNTPNGSKLSLEKGYFVKIYNISMKQTEWDSFCLKKLLFLLKLTIFDDKPSVGRRLSFENWLKSVVSLKLADFMKIQ